MPIQNNRLRTEPALLQVPSGVRPAGAQVRALRRRRPAPPGPWHPRAARRRDALIKGNVSKLVHTFGSRWGRIRPSGESREVFFNPACLDDPESFDGMTGGQEVEFLQGMDRANDTHAVHVIAA